ncbi:MAG: group II truncated hemoglobin [Planctomycetota bacterium]
MSFTESNTPFEALGNEADVRALVDAFYDRMDSAPDYAGIRAMHAPNLTEARDKLYKFLVGWLGGPPLYTQEFGHPRLRMRHAPFSISESERDQWLGCMADAMNECNITGDLRTFLDQRFAHVANFMRNRS